MITSNACHPPINSEAILALGVSSFSQRGHGGRFYANKTPYISELNRALQLEQVATSLYAAKQRSSLAASLVNSSALYRTNQHFSAQRNLVRLIFAHSGLPESEPASLAAVTGSVAVKFSQYMPNLMQDPVLGVSARRIEMALSRRYRQILKIAPDSDRDLITSLLEQSNEFYNYY